MLFTASLLLGLLTTIFGVTGEVLVKRAVPFGTPPSESHELAKRTTLTWDSAISRGACFLGQFTSGGPQSTYTDYSSLTTYGWIEDDDEGVNTPQADLADALNGLDLSSATPPNQFGKNHPFSRQLGDPLMRLGCRNPRAEDENLLTRI